MHPTPVQDWRPAWLRGVSAGAAGPHALVCPSPGQWLRVPLSEAERCMWEAQIGRCVWIDVAGQPYRLALRAPGARHA